MDKKAKGPLGSSLSEMTVELLQKDIRFREEYIKTALEEKNLSLLAARLRNVVEALGGIGRLAQVTGLNRPSLYKSLSGSRVPDFSTIEKVCDFAGFALSVVPKITGKKPRRALARAS